jgi:CheY-like chemotaxis protein
MLAYSGKGKFVISNLNLNSTISEISHLLQMSVSKTAAMEFHLDPKLPEVDGDAAQIHQVLMNLIINASVALEGKTGTITVSTGTRKCQREDLDDFNVADELPEGTYVFVEVSDTGCGMDPETLKRVFDPFFTTKFTGRGLGMAAVLGIVRSHRGVIKVNSRKNVGTTFTMLLPSSQDKKHSRKAESTAVQLIASSGKILVIDDEEVVLDIVKTTLEQAGFVVLTSRNGREGLEKFQKNKDEISLIVLDLTMPHMDGEEVLQRVKSQRKDIPVLMMSGYNQQSIINQFVDEDLAGFLQKPLRPTILLNAVNKILTDSRL